MVRDALDTARRIVKEKVRRRWSRSCRVCVRAVILLHQYVGFRFLNDTAVVVWFANDTVLVREGPEPKPSQWEADQALAAMPCAL